MRAIEKKSRTTLLWALCLCLVVLGVMGTAWAATRISDMKVGDRIYTSGSFIPVTAGTQVRVEPIPQTVFDYDGWIGQQYWFMGSGWERADETEYFASVDVGMEPVVVKTTFKWCRWEGEVGASAILSEDAYASVILVPTNPPKVSIWTTMPGGALLVPGVETEFAGSVDPASAPSGTGYKNLWQVLKGGNPVSTELYYTSNAYKPSFRVNPKVRTDIWKLDGATVRYTVSDKANNSLSAFAELPVYIAIQVAPAYGQTVVVPAVMRGGFLRAALKLTSVIGGNAAAEGLTYQWQWRSSTAGSAWQNVSAAEGTRQDGTYEVSIPESQVNGDYEFRCIVARAGSTPDPTKDTLSAKFVVTEREVGLQLDPNVTLTPLDGVALRTGEKLDETTVRGIILTPANKPDNPDATQYSFSILKEDGDTWTPMDIYPPTWGGAYNPNDPIEVKFVPEKGNHRYKLWVKSDAAESAWDETYPFSIRGIDAGNVKIICSSLPVARSDGYIHVKPGESIEYTVLMKGGTKQWRVDWTEGGQPISPVVTNPIWTDETPTHKLQVAGTAYMVGRGGQGIPSPSFPANGFGVPFIDLTWLTGFQTPLVISKTNLLAHGSLSITPEAKSGVDPAHYSYFWHIADARDPDPSAADIKGTGPKTFTFIESDIPLDPEALGTQYFDLWLRATDGTQTIVGSLPLIVTDGATVLLSAWLNGEEAARWAGDGYVAACYENAMPELRASVVEGDSAKFRWTLDGEVVSATGSNWTPTGLTAQSKPYEIVAEALNAAGEVVAKTNIDLTVNDSYELNATASFENETVEPGTVEKLTIKVQETAVNAVYTFTAGLSKNSMITLDQKTPDVSAVYSVTAPSEPGTYEYWWSVTNASGGYTLKSTKLTVASDSTLFSISAPEGAPTTKGSSFYTQIVSLGSQNVTASMLDWFSSPESVATVDSYGRVTIKGEAGTEATITATLKTDAAQRSSYRIAVTGGSDPVTDYKTGIPAKFTFKPGQTVDMKFDSTPANAVYSGTVLEGLTLSSDGRLTGTAPDKEGTYSLGTITVTWPGHSETFNAEGTITVKKSNNSGGGGGCNGGFGIFALALGAFWALKRK